jgi:DNA-binding NarL/FixJ family response regulator
MTQLAIRVLLIEDHFLARMALHSVLSGRSDIEIVGKRRCRRHRTLPAMRS